MASNDIITSDSGSGSVQDLTNPPSDSSHKSKGSNQPIIGDNSLPVGDVPSDIEMAPMVCLLKRRPLCMSERICPLCGVVVASDSHPRTYGLVLARLCKCSAFRQAWRRDFVPLD